MLTNINMSMYNYFMHDYFWFEIFVESSLKLEKVWIYNDVVHISLAEKILASYLWVSMAKLPVDI